MRFVGHRASIFRAVSDDQPSVDGPEREVFPGQVTDQPGTSATGIVEQHLVVSRPMPPSSWHPSFATAFKRAQQTERIAGIESDSNLFNSTLRIRVYVSLFSGTLRNAKY
jgi:hypothetical protein